MEPLPTQANPTELLADRFLAWRSFIKGLVAYFKDVVLVHEETLLQQVRLLQLVATNFPLADTVAPPTQGTNTAEEIAAMKRYFLPFGSGLVLDVPNTFNNYHKTTGSYVLRTSKELSQQLIPRLEGLRADLLVKIKEIRNLALDFKTSISREVSLTKEELNAFQSAVDMCKAVRLGSLPAKQDPYLAKIALDRQIRRQLLEENYLHEAFVNIQTSGMELEKLVVMEVQNVLKVYARLIGEESQVAFTALLNKLDEGFVTRAPDEEWKTFIALNPNNFIDVEHVKVRRFLDIHYKYMDDPVALEVRLSFLERRLKFLKSYSRGWYVLTPTFLHEFKSSDRKKDATPTFSMSLDECQVSEHSKKDTVNPGTWHKFVLHTKQNGIIHRGHNWVFRAQLYDLMIAWYNDLKKLTQLPTPEARALYIAEKLQLQRLKEEHKDSVRNSVVDSARAGTHGQGGFNAVLGEGDVDQHLTQEKDTSSLKYPTHEVQSQPVQQLHLDEQRRYSMGYYDPVQRSQLLAVLNGPPAAVNRLMSMMSYRPISGGNAAVSMMQQPLNQSSQQINQIGQPMLHQPSHSMSQVNLYQMNHINQGLISQGHSLGNGVVMSDPLIQNGVTGQVPNLAPSQVPNQGPNVAQGQSPGGQGQVPVMMQSVQGQVPYVMMNGYLAPAASNNTYVSVPSNTYYQEYPQANHMNGKGTGESGESGGTTAVGVDESFGTGATTFV